MEGRIPIIPTVAGLTTVYFPELAVTFLILSACPEPILEYGSVSPIFKRANQMRLTVFKFGIHSKQ